MISTWTEVSLNAVDSPSLAFVCVQQVPMDFLVDSMYLR